ncbi:hypothetical protein [Alicyclobacillus mengziensis]|uniref:Uncharacterized protein n=1 Tax=Alicyclobacillus mengziensis TaxID=2931921 RepID=A0A9X7VY32_9BACL|nr:hypothetical protein [Alicyclobacillus mengziensis]QSO46725.1 hypothetical protein JZ786_20140 [Alicyclobacillus mengziensis]
MRNLLKLIVVGVASMFIVAGCGRSEPTKLTPITGVTPAPKILPYDGHNWISYTLPSIRNYYVLSSTQISKVGKLLYNLHGTNPIDYSGSYWRTDDRNAVRVYSIPSVNTNKAVAVRLHNGIYVEARSVGNKQPE